MKTLIIGAGEVGKSLAKVLETTHQVYLQDAVPSDVEGVQVLNICFPYSDTFNQSVRGYIERYKPSVTIIHSTVPVGTSRGLGAVHSPIHGKHPNLSDGILTFVKYIGSASMDDATIASSFLESAGITTRIVSSPEASELSKILCTSYYGWNIVFAKESKRICEEQGVPFDEVYGWNKLYNEGYQELGMKQFTRPELDDVPGPIGGHCVVQNCKLLKSPITDFILKQNETYDQTT
jgi:3-hydroxyisobutyrate dehydrogenase-like beta-hydroxyacid dehydrogenase